MNNLDITHWQNIVMQYVTDFGVKIIAAIAFWIVGRWLIGMSLRLIDKSLGAGPQKVDPTVLRYIHNIVNVTLNILLVIGILGYFGIQTTTFAALLAAAGVAIGMAWSGLLANFAAGAFLIVLRPFKVGDFVSVAGLTGTIKEIGLFATNIVYRYARQRFMRGRQQQDFWRHHPELHRQSLSSRRPESTAGRQCRPSGGDGLAEAGNGENPQCDERSRARSQYHRIHPGWPGAGGTPVLPQ